MLDFDWIISTLKEAMEDDNWDLVREVIAYLKDYDIFDLGHIKIKSFYELLVIVANCSAFVSVDTALQHIAANEFCQKKGVVLWNNKCNIKLYGYDININLFNEFIQPFSDYNIILKNLKTLL